MMKVNLIYAKVLMGSDAVAGAGIPKN